MKFPFMNQNRKQAAEQSPANEERACPQPEPRLRLELLEPRVAPSFVGPGR